MAKTKINKQTRRQKNQASGKRTRGSRRKGGFNWSHLKPRDLGISSFFKRTYHGLRDRFTRKKPSHEHQKPLEEFGLEERDEPEYPHPPSHPTPSVSPSQTRKTQRSFFSFGSKHEDFDTETDEGEEDYQAYLDNFAKCHNAQSRFRRWTRTGVCKGNATKFLLSKNRKDELKEELKKNIEEKLNNTPQGMTAHQAVKDAIEIHFIQTFPSTEKHDAYQRVVTEKTKTDEPIYPAKLYLTKEDKKELELEKYAKKSIPTSTSSFPPRPEHEDEEGFFINKENKSRSHGLNSPENFDTHIGGTHPKSKRRGRRTKKNR